MPVKFQKKPEGDHAVHALAKLSGPQAKAACVLASGGLKKEAAAAAGVHAPAVSEWLKLPSFRAALDEMRCNLAAEAALELKSLVAESVLTLRAALREGPPAVRLRAAVYTLDHVLLGDFGQPTQNPGLKGKNISGGDLLAQFSGYITGNDKLKDGLLTMISGIMEDVKKDAAIG